MSRPQHVQINGGGAYVIAECMRCGEKKFFAHAPRGALGRARLVLEVSEFSAQHAPCVEQLSLIFAQQNGPAAFMRPGPGRT